MSPDNGYKKIEEAMLIWGALAELGFSTTPKELVDKINQLKRGLPKEDEFIALSIWMDKCTLIHKLDQKQYPTLSKREYQIPDLFACYKYNGRDVQVLIEVKSTKRKKLRFTNVDYNRRMKYSQITGLPILIAWHLKGWDLWCLFELSKMQKKVSAFCIDFETAIREDLMGVLLDNVIFSIKKGTKLVMQIEIEKGTEVRNETDQTLEEFIGMLKDIEFVSVAGERISSGSPLSKFLYYTFMLVYTDASSTDDGNYVTQTFYTNEDQTVFGYQILGVASFGTKSFDNPELNWLDIIKNESFTISYEDIKSGAKEGVRKGVVKYVIRNLPKPVPRFLEQGLGK